MKRPMKNNGYVLISVLSFIIATATIAIGGVSLSGKPAVESDKKIFHKVSGYIEGLKSPLILKNNFSSEKLHIELNGFFSFTKPIIHNGLYRIYIKKHPFGQFCKIVNNSGRARASVTDIRIHCREAALVLYASDTDNYSTINAKKNTSSDTLHKNCQNTLSRPRGFRKYISLGHFSRKNKSINFHFPSYTDNYIKKLFSSDTSDIPNLKVITTTGKKITESLKNLSRENIQKKLQLVNFFQKKLDNPDNDLVKNTLKQGTIICIAYTPYSSGLSAYIMAEGAYKRLLLIIVFAGMFIAMVIIIGINVYQRRNE